MGDSSKLKLLLVDDDDAMLGIVQETLEQSHYDILTAHSYDEALDVVERCHSTLVMVISDYQMPDKNGFELRRALLPKYKNIPFVIMSGFITKDFALEGLENKITAFLEKPFENEKLLALVDRETGDRANEIAEENEIIDGFIEEGKELLEELEELVLDFESEASLGTTLDRICAIVHTIKGTSGFFNPDIINRFCHQFEDILVELKNGKRPIESNIISLILRSVDKIGDLISSLERREIESLDEEEVFSVLRIESSVKRGQEPGSYSEEKIEKPVKADKERSQKIDEIKVATQTLDQFMESSGEMTVLRNMISKLLLEIEKKYGQNREMKFLIELLDEMHKINSGIQSKISELRKVSIRTIMRSLQRTVRDVSENLKKDVQFEVTGEHLRLDKKVSDVLSSTLIHLTRNAVDHGIESKEERAKTGKNSVATISLSVSETSEEIVTQISDDGKGMDPNRIRLKLVEKNLYTEQECHEFSDTQVLQKIFEPGFSTADQISDISGRGVGMDMVRTTVEAAGGSVAIQSELGKGTTIELRIPVPRSVLIVNSLLVENQGQTFAIPYDRIERIVDLNQDTCSDLIEEVDHQKVIRIDDQLVDMFSLSGLIGGEGSTEDLGFALILNGSHKNFALQVSKIKDMENTVVKKVHHLEKDMPFLGGATFLGRGAIGLILDVDHLESFLYPTYGIKGQSSKTSSDTGDGTASGEAHEASVEQEATYVLFEENGDLYAAPCDQIFRLESFLDKDVYQSGGTLVMQYREQVVPIFNLFSDRIHLLSADESLSFSALLLEHKKHFFAFHVDCIQDLRRINEADLKDSFSPNKAIKGNAVCEGKTIPIVDLEYCVKKHTNSKKQDVRAEIVKAS